MSALPFCSCLRASPVISRAFAYGGRTPQFEFASGILIVLIGVFLLWRSLARNHGGTAGNGRTLAFA